MQKALFQTLAVLAVASSPAWAQAPKAEAIAIEAKGETGGMVAQVVEFQATVTAIDKVNRVVTLKGPDGKLRTFKVGEEARNFNQAEVGDILTLKYQEALALQLEKTPGAKPGKSVSEEMTRAKAGDKPGGMAQRTVTVVGTVTAIDMKTQRVTVRGPEGNELDIKVQDPAKLKKVKTGDLVSAMYTEALVISVATPAKADAMKKK
jgi:Cu/Ag efflux protein CusF